MITSVVGALSFADHNILARTRMRYARVCIEMEEEFLSFIHVLYDDKEFKVSIEYTWKPTRCKNCATFGHSCAKCSKASKKVWMPKPKEYIC